MAVLAVDIGGTKMAAAIADRTGALTARAQTPTAANGDGEALFDDLMALIAGVRAEAGDPRIEACGVGCGGPMTAGGETVSPLNITAWREFPLRGRLQDALGVESFVDNDAKALALAEGWRGAAAGIADFIAMVVSTGIGGGIVSGGRLLDGASGNAGHVGHVFVVDGTEPWDRHPAGLLESEASGTGIAVRTGAPAADAGLDVVEGVGRLVGRGVASVCNLLDLRLAVVAGSVALGYGEPFFAAAQAELDRLTADLDFSRGARIVPGGLGDEGPLVGGCAVALRGMGVDIGIR